MLNKKIKRRRRKEKEKEEKRLESIAWPLHRNSRKRVDGLGHSVVGFEYVKSCAILGANFLWIREVKSWN